MSTGPFAQLLSFLNDHETCSDVTLDLCRLRETGENFYSIRCQCGAELERPIPGPDDRYCIIFNCLTLVSEN